MSGWQYCPSDPYFTIHGFVLPTSYTLYFSDSDVCSEHLSYWIGAPSAADGTEIAIKYRYDSLNATAIRVYDAFDEEWINKEQTTTTAATTTTTGAVEPSKPAQPQLMRISPVRLSLCTGAARSLLATLKVPGSPSAKQLVQPEPKPFGRCQFAIEPCFDNRYRRAEFDVKLYVVEGWSGGHSTGFRPRWIGEMKEYPSPADMQKAKSAPTVKPIILETR